MSVEAMAVVLHHSRASGTDKLVLLGIANHDGDGGAWPTISTLAKYANVSERSVQQAIGRLKDAGELDVMVNAGGTAHMEARYRPNLYAIRVCCPPDCDRSTNHKTGVTLSSPLDGSGVKPSAVRGEVEGNSGVKPTSPKPSIEPSLEPSPHDDSASMLLFDVPEQPRTVPDKTAQTLVGRWVDGHRAAGQPDPPQVFMLRVAGQCKALARSCKSDDDWSAAWHAAFLAGEKGRVDPVPLMVQARSMFQSRGNGYIDLVKSDHARSLSLLGIDPTTPPELT